jgi:hypothetical protein
MKIPAHVFGLVLTGLVLSGGCNQYELFRVAGYQQENYSNDAEILFVIDNSSSMQAESEKLAIHFDKFIQHLTDPTQGGATYEGLDDAVDNYIRYVSERGRFLDFQLAITTTDVESTFGDLYALDSSNRLLPKDTANVGEKFRENLLCTATCFEEFGMASNPDHQCGDPIGEEVTRQYLDCLCGEDVWESRCGSGQEEGLEAIFMAMCRAAETPPAECFGNENQFEETHVGSNAGLIRDDSTVLAIIVTDEGDVSRRLPQGEAIPEVYEQLFAKFNTRMGFAVIGPRTDVCNSGGATRWGIQRYQWFVEDTGGLYLDIAEKTEEDECIVADFSKSLEELGSLLSSLLEVFPLQSVPDVSTIKAFVDGDEVLPSEETLNEETGETQFGTGWRYLASENGVQFVGEAVPDYNADVRIFYRPLSGMPRQLPYGE